MNYTGKLEDEEGNVFYPETILHGEPLYSGKNSDLTVTLNKHIRSYDFIEAIFQRGSDYGTATTGKMQVINRYTDNANAHGATDLVYMGNLYQARITVKVDVAGDVLTKRSHRVNFSGNAVEGPAGYNTEQFWLIRVIGYKINK